SRRRCLWRLRQDRRLRQGPAGSAPGPGRHDLPRPGRAPGNPPGQGRRYPSHHYRPADPGFVRLTVCLEPAMNSRRATRCWALLPAAFLIGALAARPEPPKKAVANTRDAVLDVRPAPIAGDPSVRYDFDIVYVRAPRHGDEKGIAWTEV